MKPLDLLHFISWQTKRREHRTLKRDREIAKRSDLDGISFEATTSYSSDVAIFDMFIRAVRIALSL